MDTRRVLYFLDMLCNETEGHRGEIVALYKRALDENDIIISLRGLLEECVSYGEVGKAVCATGANILDEIYSEPSKALETLPRLKHAFETIEKEIDVCTGLLQSPFPFSDSITILKKRDISAYIGALKMIANVCVYLTATYAGLAPLKYLTWNNSVGIQEMIYAVNTKFLPMLCEAEKPSYSWVIRKKPLGGKLMFGGDAFYLSYEEIGDIEVLCSILHKEPMGTHSFLNVDAYECGENDVPFCWGVGNLLSVLPEDATQLLQTEVQTTLRCPTADDYKGRMPTPIECVAHLANGSVFCITPDELVLAMNRWLVGGEIEKRKQTHNCLFCGKNTGGRGLVCSSHFVSEFR